jgi:Class II flagellar assembly regulator
VAAPAQRASAMPPASGVLALDGMLALQEVGDEIVRDREAKRHGQALLKGLAALQHALLAGEDQSAVLQTLAALAENCPQAAHPGLAGVVQALALRAQVELARRDL